MTRVTHEPESIEDLAATIRAHRDEGVRLIGAGTKPALVGPARAGPELAGRVRAGEAWIASRRLTGILDYTAAEFTITARAGTPIQEIDATLAEHGQYLPFDPPFSGRLEPRVTVAGATVAGATLGGAIASGLAGPGRVRFGGVRDFVLAVTYVDGRGRVLRGGAKVVKNAAGFDLPKLLVGSLGRLAALAEITLKVLPHPRVCHSARFRFPHFAAAYEGLVALGTSPFELNGLELLDGNSLLVRLGGSSREAAGQRLARLERLLGVPGEPISASDEAATWHALADCRDLLPEGQEDATLVKVALSPRRIPDLEAVVRAMRAERRYGAGGAVAWLALPDTTRDDRVADLDRRLAGLGLPALLVRGPRRGDPRLGHRPGESMLTRIKRVLDPDGVLPGLGSTPSG